MTPEQALLRVIHCLDRALASPFKTKAFVRALDVVRTSDPVELAERARDDRLTELDGIGDATAGVITEAYLPSTVFPTGPSKQGLPIGLQAVSGEYHDYTTIEFARLMANEIGGFVAPDGYGD